MKNTKNSPTAKSAATKKSLRPQSQRLVLEPRIVFDAVLPVMGAEIVDHFAEQNIAQAPEFNHAIEAPAIEAPAEKPINDNEQTAASDRALIDGTLAPTNLSSNEIIFIDAIVADLQQYITNHPNADVVLLDSSKDGLAQIAAVLNGRTGIESVHILSHGSSGELQIGNGVLNIQNLLSAEHAESLAIIGQALSADADILIYGCDVGAGDKGQLFVNALAANTGADVAASLDTTGAAETFGGDWQLETQTGTIEARNLQLADWQGQLAYTNTAAGGAWAISAAANTATVPVTLTNTTDGITTTVTLGGPANAWTTTAVQTLNNIAAFSNGAQNTADFTTTFNTASTAGVTGTVTITFSKPIINPVIHIDRIGGVSGTSNSSVWTLATAGATLTKLAGSSSLAVTGTTIQRTTGVATAGGESSLTDALGTAAGSIQVNGTYTTLTFNVTGAADGFELAFALDAPPVATNDTFVSVGNATVAGNLITGNNGAGVDSDVRGDALSITKINGVNYTVGSPIALANGTLTISAATGAFSFVPNPGFADSQTFTYTIADPNGGTSTATVTINADTDGDGIINSTDLDDDNDGILDTVEGSSVVFQETFGTGTTRESFASAGITGATTYTYAGAGQIQDGSYVLASGYQADSTWFGGFFDTTFLDHTVDTNGRMMFINAAFAPGIFYENNFTVGKSGDYTFSVWARNANSLSIKPNITIRVFDLSNNLVGTTNTGNLPDFAVSPPNWNEYSLTLNLAPGTYNFEFVNNAPGGGGNDLWIDDISVTQKTPDTDNDGVFDSLDLDSDNDGISDLSESTGGTGDALADTNKDGTVSKAESVAAGATGSGDIDNDGLMDIFDANTANATGAASLGNTPINSDGDTKADYLDLDSDNDGIADTVEARLTAGYVANDGNVSNNDADKDGVIDIFDTNDGTTKLFGGTFTTPVNTDGADLVDYLDTDSDNDGKLDSVESGLSTVTTDANGDGIRDSVNASYTDPDGLVNNPQVNLANEFGSTAEVAYREVNKAPIIDLNSAATLADTTRANATTYAENATPVNVATGTAGTNDNGDADVSTMTIGLSGLVNGANEAISIGGLNFPSNANSTQTATIGGTLFSITYSTATGFTITKQGGGAMPPADMDTLVRGITYANTSENPTAGARLLTFVLTDLAGLVSPSAVATVTVTAVNDAPLGTDKTITINEDATYTVTAADFGFTDVDSNAFTNVIVTSRPPATDGVYQLNGVAIATNQVITVADINAGLLKFVPATNKNGTTIGALGFKVQDNGGTANTGVDTDPTANILNFTITAVNDAPTVSLPATGVLTTVEDTPLILNNITLADVDATTGSETVTVTIGAGQGVLNWTATPFVSVTNNGTGTITLSGQISAIRNAITTGNALSYAPTPDFNGTASLSVTINDNGNTGTGGALSATATTNITVTPVADTVNDAVTTNEDTPITFNVLTNLPANGASADNFENSGAAVTATSTPLHGSVTFSANGSLVYTPTAGYNGTDTFTYTVTSGGVTETATVTVTINSVNDAPTGANITGTATEDTPYTVTAANFGFADANDTPANAFANVIIGATLPPASQGVYQLGGVNISAGQVISVADINAGLLKFVPAPNFNGTSVAALPFNVQDNGGTANGGANTSVATNTFTLNIAAVDDVITFGGLNDGPGGTGGSDAQVKESDLATGSTPAGTGETAGGTFTVGPDSSLTSITLNGGATITKTQLAAATVGSPITATGTNGTLSITGYNPSTGVVTYSYTLTSTANHTGNINVNDNFVIQTTDVEGQTASGTLGINILDDAPVLVADTDETINISGNPSSTASGNVFSGVGGTDPNSADGNKDTAGADGNATPVTGVVAGTGTPLAGNLGGFGITTALGTLVMNSNGSYIYTPNYLNPTVAALLPGATLADTFTYEVTDGDGDKATTTLTVTIVGVPAVVGLGDGTVAGTDGSVLESDLGTTNSLGTTAAGVGSNAVGVGETLNGTFQLVSPAFPVTEITVGTTVISIASLTASGTTPITIAGSTGAGAGRGALIINGYNAGTGVVNYTYTLNTPDNSGGTVIENFAVSLKDSANNVTPPKNLGIAIIDDAPIANADTGTATEDSATATTGNVFTNDKIGADGASTAPTGPVTGVKAGTGTPTSTGINTGVAGSYGTLTLQADGTYSYVANNANPAVNALKVGQSLTETYTYKITDKDGDESTATLTITINGANDAPVANDNIYNMNEDAGTITLNPLNGDTDAEGDTLSIQSITNDLGNPVAITPGTAQSIPVNGGTVNVSAGGVVTFTPNANFNGQVTFPYTISDGTTTSTANQIINVAAVNDAPIATSNAKNIVEDAPGGATGNVITENNGFGIDSDPDTGNNTGLTVTQFSIAGVPGSFAAGTTATIAAGTVRINADGSYVFTPALNFNGPVPEITYTISDGSGAINQTATSTLNIIVTPADDAPVNTVPGTQNTSEDTPIVFSTANGNAIQIADVDGGTQTVTLTMANGTTSLSSVTGLTFTTGDGTDDSVMTFSGSIAAINAALNGLTFTPTPDYNNTSTIAPQASISIKTLGSELVPSFINGGFEQGTGLSTAITFNSLNENDIPGWDTSATDNLIEIWRSGFSGIPAVFPFIAYEGDFLAELNAEQFSTLSNTFTPTAGTSLNIDFAHRGREGTDVMQLQAIDLGTDGVLGGVGANADTVLFSQNYTDGNATWGAYTANITQNATGNAIQLAFTAVTSASGAATEGNLLDGVVVRQSTTVENVVNINVTPVKDTVADNLTTPVNTQITFNALTNTPVNGAAADNFEGSPIITSITQPLASAGSVTFTAAGSMTFTPVAGFTGTATYTYTVTSPAGVTETETVTITVVNETPVANTDNVSTLEDNPISGSITANDSDAEGATLTVTSFSIVGQTGPFTLGTLYTITGVGDITINSDGTYTFNPALNFNGAVPVINYTINDGSGASNATASSTLNINVTPVNDAPVAVDDGTVAIPLAIVEDTPTPLNLLGNDTDVDGDTLSIQSINGTTITPGTAQTIAVPNGTVNVSALGVVTFTPALNYNGPITFDYVVQDSSGLTDTGSVNLNVTPVNDAPVAVDDGTVAIPLAIVEDTPTPLNLLGNDTDVDGDTLSIQSINGTTITPGTAQTIAVPNGTVNVSALGVVTFTPALNYNGPITFDYVVQDSSGLTDTGSVNLNVTPVNDAPVAVDDGTVAIPLAIVEDTPTPLNLLGNDTDVDGDTLSIQSINGTTITPGTAQTIAVPNGTVNVSALGVVTFTPALNYNGPITFDYVVQDSSGLTDTGSVNLNVTPVNDAPVAVDDGTVAIPLAIVEDTPTPLNLLGNDTDVDGDTLSIQSINGTTITPGTAQTIAVPNGTVNVSALGVVTFTPALNYNGPITFDYVVQDSSGLTDTGSVNLNVTPVNDAPVAVDDGTVAIPLAIVEDTPTPLNLLGNDTDVDGDTLSIQSINGTTITPGTAQTIAVPNGTVNVSALGVVTFTPALNYNGPITFDYVVQDSSGLTDTGSVNLNVTPVNDAPVAVDDGTVAIPLAIVEDTPTPLNLLGNDTDVDGDTLSIQSINGTTITPGTAQTIAVPNGTVNVSALGVVTFTPALNYNGPITFDYVVQDSSGLTDTGSVNLNVTPVNDAPVAVDDGTVAIPLAIVEDTPTPLNLLGNDTDVDGDTLSIQSINGTTITPGTAQTIAVPNGIVTVSPTGVITFTPNANYFGPATFDYVIQDPTGATDTGTVNIAVSSVNDPPVAINASKNTPEDIDAIVTLVGTDVDGTVASVTVTALPLSTEGVLYLANGTTPVLEGALLTPAQAASLVFKPALNFNGIVTIPFIVTDNQGAPSIPARFVIDVGSVNDDPVATPAVLTGNEDSPIPVSLTGSDTEGPITAITINTLPPASQGVLVKADGTPVIAGVPLTPTEAAGLVFNPAPNFSGLVGPIPFTVTDSVGQISSPPATLRINVTPVNDAPTAVDDVVTAPSGISTILNLAGNDIDIDGDVLSVKSINGTLLTPGTAQTITVPNGVVTVSATGVISFTPNPGYSGPVSFDYVVQDGNGGEDAGNVAITVSQSTDVLFEQLGTQRNLFGEGLDPNRPDPFAIRSPVIPIGMPEDLFVTNSVRESAMRIAQNSNFGVFNVDAPTRGELDNLTYDLKGLPVGMDPTLFVQHAVRSLPITQEPRLFVQNAVRQSQLESTMRNIGVTSYNTATNSISSLFSPFDLGSPNDAVDLSIDGVNGEFTDKTSETHTKQATELALDVSNESVVDLKALELPIAKEVDIKAVSKEISVKLTQPAEAKKMAAASFANQLTAAAKKFKSNDFFNPSN